MGPEPKSLRHRVIQRWQPALFDLGRLPGQLLARGIWLVTCSLPIEAPGKIRGEGRVWV